MISKLEMAGDEQMQWEHFSGRGAHTPMEGRSNAHLCWATVGVASHGADTDCFREMEAKGGFLGFHKRAMKTTLETTKGANTASGLTKSKGGLLDNCWVVHRVTHRMLPTEHVGKQWSPFVLQRPQCQRKDPVQLLKLKVHTFTFPLGLSERGTPYCMDCKTIPEQKSVREMPMYSSATASKPYTPRGTKGDQEAIGTQIISASVALLFLRRQKHTFTHPRLGAYDRPKHRHHQSPGWWTTMFH